MNSSELILVDPEDRQVGVGAKLPVHQEGLLHRAFSVFLVNPQGQILLQQRAVEKYHSGGLWTNACCGHPSPGEEAPEAAIRRTQEELGIVCQPRRVLRCRYQLDVGEGLLERELNHVFVAFWDHPLDPDPAEVQDLRWLSEREILAEVEASPETFTVWFRALFPVVQPFLALATQGLDSGASFRGI